MMSKANANTELITEVGAVGNFDYVVNIQKRFNWQDHSKPGYAVGVLVDIQFVLTTCSIFYDAVHEQASPEDKKHKDFRIVGDGVIGHQVQNLDGRKIRFIDTVILHPDCRQPDGVYNGWKYDLALARTTIPFDLMPGVVGEMKFGFFSKGGVIQRLKDRSQQFTKYRDQHTSVVNLNNNSAVCLVMSWGRRDRVTDPSTGVATEFFTSPRLLLYRVKLASESDCQEFCSEDVRFCGMNNTVSPSMVCAFRGNVTFEYQGVDYSAYPCAGTEGSPLICYPAGYPQKADIYGLVATIPPLACVRKQLPVIVTRIETVSHFVIDVVGKAFVPLMNLSFILSALCITWSL